MRFRQFFPVVSRYVALVGISVLGVLAILGTGGGGLSGGSTGWVSLGACHLVDINGNESCQDSLKEGDCNALISQPNISHGRWERHGTCFYAKPY